MLQMRSVLFSFFCASLLLGVAGCGDSSDSPRASEFSPSMSVTEVAYELREYQIEAEFWDRDGNYRRYHDNLRSDSNLTMERVSRVVEDNVFTILMNGQKLPVAVSGSGEFNEGEPLDRDGDCNQRGSESISGFSYFSQFELNYEMHLQADGESCSQRFLTSFEEEQIARIGQLNLNLVSRLQEAGAWQHEDVQQIRVKIRMKGVSN